ncbi:MAG: dUTP diphosphatase [Paracoccaceae bacterium]
MTETLRILRTDAADPTIPLPAYATKGAAGMDVRVNFPPEMREAGVVLGAGTRALIPTGLKFEIPAGFEVQIRPRSGLALKHGLTQVNAPGTIDSDYRGEVGMLLINHGNAPFHVTHGMRIAQLVFAPVIQCAIQEVGDITASTRGTGGFGSTGIL